MKRIALMAVLLALASAPAFATGIYSLAGDWSDALNPNGTWLYRAGTTLLVHTADWGTPATTGFVQPAWDMSATPSMGAGNLLPAIFKAVQDGSTTTRGDDFLTGDVVMHPNSPGNGNDTDVANVTWVAPYDAIIDIQLGLWQTGFRSRDQTARLLVNGVSQVYFPSLNSYTRSSQASYSGLGLAIHAGELVELDLVRTTDSDSYLNGIDLRITATTVPEPGNVPEPGSMLLLGSGLAFVARKLRRQR